MKTRHKFYIILLMSSVLISYSNAQDNTQVGLPEGAIARLGKSEINVMQFSPDGKLLAVGTSIGVWLYNVHDGKEKLLSTGKHENIIALAFSPDGKMLATGSHTEHVIQIWEINSDNIQPTITLHDRFAEISSLVFAKDNKRLYSLSKHGFHTEWDIITGKEISAMQFNESWSVIAFAKYGTTFAIGDPNNNKICLWDSVNRDLGEVYKKQSNEILRTPHSKLIRTNHTNNKIQRGVEAIVFSHDSKTIASSHDDNIVRLWDTTNRAQRYSFKGHNEIISTLAFSPDNKILASGSDDNDILLWNVKTGHHLATLSGHNNSVKTLTFSPTDNGLLASGSTDGTVRFWNTNTGRVRSIFATGHTVDIQAVAFNKNDTILCSALLNGTVQIWNLKTGKELPVQMLPQFDMVNALALSQDATLFVYNGVDNIVKSEGISIVIRSESSKDTRLLVLPTGNELISFPIEASALAFSPKNFVLAAVIPHEAVELWNLNSGEKMYRFDIDHSFSEKLLFSPNGKYLARIGDYKQLQLWDVTTQQKITTPAIKKFSTITFSPDSLTIAMQVSNGVDLLKIKSSGLEKLKKIQSLQGYCDILLYSPDGKHLIRAHTVSDRSVIMILDVDSGNILSTISGHVQWIRTLVFSHDGKILASGNADGTILLWDWEKILKKAGKE